MIALCRHSAPKESPALPATGHCIGKPRSAPRFRSFKKPLAVVTTHRRGRCLSLEPPARMEYGCIRTCSLVHPTIPATLWPQYVKLPPVDMTMSSPVRTAVILASGLGRRMWPYGDLRPKAIFPPILNQPLIARQIDDLTAIGLTRFVVVTGHQSQRVRHALSGRDNVAFARQDKPEGTAAALLSAMPLVDDDVFLVVDGDLLLDRTDLRNLLRAFDTGACAGAALVRAMGGEDSRDWIPATLPKES